MNRRHVGLLSVGHLITDINQGAVPALLPFLIAAHDLSYAAAAGIVFATNFASTIVQPLFGHAADRFSNPWLMPVGIVLAGLGMALTGIVPSYRLIILAAIISGIGVAAFHPEGARLVNFVSGDRKATAMSVFGVGGVLGFTFGPLITTAALLYWGLKGTLVLIVPVVMMAIVIMIHLSEFSKFSSSRKNRQTLSTDERLQDAWAPFIRLTMVVIGRSILFYGLNTFIPLYWINVLHQSKAAGGTALTIMSAAGVIGNLVGGKLADTFGYRRMILAGFSSLVPLLPIFLWVDNVYAATGLLIPIGVMLSVSYGPSVVMGHRYLPNRIGLSSGITLGVSVAIGGIAAPILGKIADLHGIWPALATLVVLPVLAAGVALSLPLPKRVRILSE